MRYFAYSPGLPGAIPPFIYAEYALLKEEADFWDTASATACLPASIELKEATDQLLTRERLLKAEGGPAALSRWRTTDDDEHYEAREQHAFARLAQAEAERDAAEGCSWAAEALTKDDEPWILWLAEEHSGTCKPQTCGRARPDLEVI